MKIEERNEMLSSHSDPSASLGFQSSRETTNQGQASVEQPSQRHDVPLKHGFFSWVSCSISDLSFQTFSNGKKETDPQIIS